MFMEKYDDFVTFPKLIKGHNYQCTLKGNLKRPSIPGRACKIHNSIVKKHQLSSK